VDNRLNDNARPQLGGDRTGIRTMDSGGGRLSLSGEHLTPDGRGCQERRIPIYGPDGQRVVAVIVDGVLTKTVDASRHFLKHPPAIALDAHAIAEAEALGVSQIAVTDRESGRVYRSTIAELRAHGWEFDRGYGAQIAMRLTRWATEGDEPPAPAPRPVAEPLQLGLW
jgi:hypothetical protein